MSTTFLALAIAAAVGGDPSLPNQTYGAYGMTEVPYNEGTPMTSAGVTGGIFGDPLYPFDSQYPWQHGYFQEISPYSGYHYFKPYNYRHVLSQTQTANGWGITPQLAYSQHFWNRYHEQAAWKNYALPPREEDIEEIQKRKREFQEKRIDQKSSSSYYQPQRGMVPVEYQQQSNNYQQQNNYQPQSGYQPQPRNFPQSSYQNQQPQYEQSQYPQQQYQPQQYQPQPQQMQPQYPANAPGYNQNPVYINR